MSSPSARISVELFFTNKNFTSRRGHFEGILDPVVIALRWFLYEEMMVWHFSGCLQASMCQSFSPRHRHSHTTTIRRSRENTKQHMAYKSHRQTQLHHPPALCHRNPSAALLRVHAGDAHKFRIVMPLPQFHQSFAALTKP